MTDTVTLVNEEAGVDCWSKDIDSAPCGHWRHSEQKSGEKVKVVTEHVHENVWLWTKCGKKLLSRWLPPNKFTPKGRWDGLGTHEQPVAWHPYFIPADPIFSKAITAAEEADR